jgi:hypothetical protein
VEILGAGLEAAQDDRARQVRVPGAEQRVVVEARVDVRVGDLTEPWTPVSVRPAPCTVAWTPVSAWSPSSRRCWTESNPSWRCQPKNADPS